jgi:hypothetical protein
MALSQEVPKAVREVDILQFLKDGAIGSLGAIPGTVASHPFDALKIRIQASGQKLSKSLSFLVSNGIYNGLSAGIQQKIITRGPMFLFSAVSTNVCYVYGNMDLTTGMASHHSPLSPSLTILLI